tara:strand:- start:331 stop:1956 length:1626 start_codon:yes stop_codon:yes gene_type:complete
MKKRGLSPLIATILLIGIIIIVAVIVLNWTSKVAEQQIEDTDLSISALTYDLSFEAECLTDETGTKVLIENNVGKSIEYMIFGLDGEIVREQTDLEPFEIDNILFPGIPHISEVKITPQVELNGEIINLLINSKTEECKLYLEIVPLFLEGCNDPDALNYNSDVDIPVDNCVYSPNGEDPPGESWEGVIFYFGNFDHENRFLEVYVGNFLSGTLNLITGYVDGVLPPANLDTSYSDYSWNIATSSDIGGRVWISLMSNPASAIPPDEQGFLFNLNYEYFDSEIFCLFDFIANDENEEVILGNCINVSSEEFLIPGCIDEDACNYNPSATLEDDSCTYPDEDYDCEGNCIVEIDCAGICGGEAVVDECDICCAGSTWVECSYWYNPNSFTGVYDCAGDCYGGAVQDCRGVCEGEAQVDSCLVCYGGTSPIYSPNLDLGLLTTGICSENNFPMCFETNAALGEGHNRGSCPPYDIRYRGSDPSYPYGLESKWGRYCGGYWGGGFGGGSGSVGDCCEQMGFGYVSLPINLGLLPEQSLYAIICE